MNDTGRHHERDLRVARAPVQWGIVVLAFAVRCLPVRRVFVDGQTHFTDSDSYYHLRRIAFNLVSFPDTLERDPYLNFPHGAEAIWPQTMDWLLALLLRPFFTPEGGVLSRELQHDIERVLVWFPPLLGALTVWLVYRIALRHFGARVALVSGLVLSVLPAHYWYSQIGFLDHHVVVALGATLLLGTTMDLVRRCVGSGGVEGVGGVESDESDREDGSAALRARLVAPAIGLGALLFANLMIWPGALLYVVLAEASLLAVFIASSGVRARRHAIVSLLIANFTAFALIAPFSLGNHWSAWSAFSAVVLSNFQPWFFTVAALFSGVGWLLFDRLSEGSGTGSGSMLLRIGVMLLVGIALLGASVVFIPELETSVQDSLQWLGRTESFQAMVGESIPLFVLHGQFTTQVASSRLSYFFYLFPVAIAWLCFEWDAEDNRPALYGFVGWALVLFLFTLLQKRFFNTFSIALAITLAVSLVKFYDVSSKWLSASRALRIGFASLVAGLLLAPSLAVHRESIIGIAGALAGAPPALDFRTDVNRARREMTSWLGRHTPVTAGYLTAAGDPEYGVLARWDEGHFIKYVARRPTVMGNFGDDLGRDHFTLARSFFTSDLGRSIEILESLGVRYVVIRPRSESRSMARTLFTSDGSRLGRYRLLHETHPLFGADVPSYKIFEFVKGAQLLGVAPPRSLVVAELDLTTNLGRAIQFEMVTEADPSGEYRLRLPYATVGQPESTRTAPRYRIRVGDTLEEVAIDESAIQSGALVLGPSFY